MARLTATSSILAIIISVAMTITAHFILQQQQHRHHQLLNWHKPLQEGLAVASIARDNPSTLPGDDPFPRAH